MLKTFKAFPFLKKWYFNSLGKNWTDQKINAFADWLTSEQKIIDIGCGNGMVSHFLHEAGYKVTPLDLKNHSYSTDIRPVIYDGNQIPFEDNTFDVALLLSVLHHTENPKKVLKEASRVSNAIIINEDVYMNIFQKYLTLATDTFVNMGFSKMTYKNKNDDEWKELFKELNLELVEVKYMRVLLFFRQAVYRLRKS